MTESGSCLDSRIDLICRIKSASICWSLRWTSSSCAFLALLPSSAFAEDGSDAKKAQELEVQRKLQQMDADLMRQIKSIRESKQEPDSVIQEIDKKPLLGLGAP